MAEPTPRGIQATLFDYFQDTEYFDLQEANELLLKHQNRDINAESIRARIYEGIEKGLFERVGKGLYTVTRMDEQGRENTCLLINGDGRDLSMFPDNSVDALITDHPYALSKSLKGGNRNFAEYELFQYNEKDFQEKQRVLKPGHFLVEFLPEENADNYQYLYQIKEMARKAGMEYYAKVAWKKGDFIANTGRKSKNAEDICFFTKGRARFLRPDAKKDKAEPGISHFMSGAAGMLPVNFDYSAPGKKDKIHQAEKPVELLMEILKYVTLPGETALDQFAGSGVLGEAALKSGRNSILIEKDAETFGKITNRLAKLGDIKSLFPAISHYIDIASDAVIAQDAFIRTGDNNIINDFIESHDIPQHETLCEIKHNVLSDKVIDAESKNAAENAFGCLENISHQFNNKILSEAKTAPHSGDIEGGSKVLECSIRGDRRFSPLFAKIIIKGKEKSIEEFYQEAKRNADGKKAGKGKAFDHIVDPFTGDKLPAKLAPDLYRGLWITYYNNNPDLIEFAKGFDDFTDAYKKDGPELTFEEAEKGLCSDKRISPAEILGAYISDKDRYISVVKASSWYKNIAKKLKKPIDEQIKSAESKLSEKEESCEQISFIENKSYRRM